MSEKSPFFVHVGYHKTATTWFQDHVFNEHPQIQYLGKAYPDHPSYRMSELKETIVSEPDTTYSSTEAREELEEILRDHPLEGHRTRGMSYEGLSAGDNWFGGRNFYVADRLAEVFRDHDVKILLGIREQRSMVESMYSEYVKLGGSESMERLFFSPFSEADDLLEKLRYGPVVQHYRETFGADSVKVYLYERFKKKKRTVLSEICDFLDLDEPDLEEETTSKKSNARLSRWGLSAMRVANHFFFGPLNNLSPVTMGSHLLARLFRALDYNTDEIRENVEREHEAALRFEQDRRLQNQLRHHANTLIENFDDQFFRGNGKHRFELDDSVRSYLEEYYREPNELLQELVAPDLTEYDYSLPDEADERSESEELTQAT